MTERWRSRPCLRVFVAVPSADTVGTPNRASYLAKLLSYFPTFLCAARLFARIKKINNVIYRMAPLRQHSLQLAPKWLSYRHLSRAPKFATALERASTLSIFKQRRLREEAEVGPPRNEKILFALNQRHFRDGFDMLGALCAFIAGHKFAGAPGKRSEKVFRLRPGPAAFSSLSRADERQREVANEPPMTRFMLTI